MSILSSVRQRHLHIPVDSSSKQGVLGSRESQLLENDRRVVVDRLNSRERLEEDQSQSKTDTLHVAPSGKELLDELPKSTISSKSLFSLDLVTGRLEFVSNVRVVFWDCISSMLVSIALGGFRYKVASLTASDSNKVGGGLLIFVLADEPSRRLWHPETSNEE